MSDHHTLPHRDFLTLPPRDYPSDDELPDPIQPAIDTLFSGFTQRHRTPSPVTFSFSRSAPDRVQAVAQTTTEPAVDLRSLDYTNEYDSHLMCPICHVPFIDPVVLDCDHTFCASCFDEYRHGAANNETSQCPSCRTYVLSSPKKASRLISNMCNDIKVECPNEDCTTTLARGCIERHVEKECLEQVLPCPDVKCLKQTKRKNFVPRQCIHTSHTECECGSVIEFGRGAYAKHRDEECPTTTIQCEQCGYRYPIKDTHQCQPGTQRTYCPGEEFGCQDHLDPEEREDHIRSCPLARLAPFLSRQSHLLSSLSEQVTQTRLRNEMLESGLERINDNLTNHLQPRLDHLYMRYQDNYHDVEEIERDHIPSAAAVHHRDLLLPAHIRDLTPSPTFSYTHFSHPQPPANSHQHLLALHESLRNNVTNIEADMTNLHNNLTELDARTSMQIMNETLRLKEELAHVNAALFSTRAQVQWLLNRERMNMGMMRGRGAPITSAQQPQPQPQSTDQESTSENQVHTSQPLDHSAYEYDQSTQSSTATSPIFNNVGLNISAGSTRRPSIRRSSGGSQERVKL